MGITKNISEVYLEIRGKLFYLCTPQTGRTRGVEREKKEFIGIIEKNTTRRLEGMRLEDTAG